MSTTHNTGSSFGEALLVSFAEGLNRTVKSFTEQVIFPAVEQGRESLRQVLAPVGQAVADYANSPEGQRTRQAFEQRDTPVQRQAAMLKRLYDDGQADLIDLRDGRR